MEDGIRLPIESRRWFNSSSDGLRQHRYLIARGRFGFGSVR